MNGNTVARDEKLGGLSSEKARLLEMLLAKQTRGTPVIRRHLREGSGAETLLPASWGQQRLWFIDQLEGVGAAYNQMW